MFANSRPGLLLIFENVSISSLVQYLLHYIFFSVYERFVDFHGKLTSIFSSFMYFLSFCFYFPRTVYNWSYIVIGFYLVD